MSNNIEEVKIEAAESKGGVVYFIKRNNLGNLFCITTEVGGKLPAEFQGQFTSPGHAQATIDAYLSRSKPHGKSSSR